MVLGIEAQNGNHNGVLDSAWNYHKKFGFNIIPKIGNSKKPAALEDKEIEYYFTHKQDADYFKDRVHLFTKSFAVVNGVNHVLTLDINSEEGNTCDETLVQHVCQTLHISENWVHKTKRGYVFTCLCTDTQQEFLDAGFPANAEAQAVGTVRPSYTYFRKAKDDSRFSLLEIRISHCQTTLPPSQHPDGPYYEFLHGTPDRPPEMISAYDLFILHQELCKPFAGNKPGATDAREPYLVDSKNETAYGKRALQNIISELEAMQSGRVKGFFDKACTLYRYANGGEIEISHLEKALLDAAGKNGSVAIRGEGYFIIQLQNAKRLVGNSRASKQSDEAHKKETAKFASPRAEVLVNKQLHEMVAETLTAVVASENNNRTVFVRDNKLVKVARDKKKGSPIIIQLGTPELRNVLSRSADFFRLKAKGEEYVKVPVSPPKEIVEAIAAPENPADWPFPVLSAIVSIPVIRQDGSVLDTPGYDDATQVYYMPTPDMKDFHIPANPTQKDAIEACAKILRVIEEFPYATQADSAAAVGATITPFLRQSFKPQQHVPIAGIDAAAPGTGKGKLVNFITILSTGDCVSIAPAPETEEEWDKRITTDLMEGNTIIAYDNIEGLLKSAKLEAVLTASTWKGRVLGQTKNVYPENRATWFATGNNMKMGGDLTERCYWVRMVAATSNPEEREFKIADLEEYTKEHRCVLIEAIFTMILAWQNAGRPQDSDLKNFRSYTYWSKTVGSILKFCGVEGFLSDRKKRKDDAATDRKQWATFLEYCYEKYGNTPHTTGEFVQECKTISVTDAGSDAGSEFFEMLPEELQNQYSEAPKNFTQILGKALEKQLQRRYGDNNYYLERGPKSRKNVSTWVVFAGSAGSNPLPTYSEKISNFHIGTVAEHSRHSLQGNENSEEKNTVEAPVEPNDTALGKNKNCMESNALPALPPEPVESFDDAFLSALDGQVGDGEVSV